MEALALRGSGHVERRSYVDRGWSAGEDLGRPADGSAGVAVSALSADSEHQELCIVTADSGICHQWQWHDEPWTDWYAMPSPPGHAVDVAAGITNALRYELTAVDDDGRFWQRSYHRGAADWTAWWQI
jgi:hypothetical protein